MTSTTAADPVIIADVCPRDGLQSLRPEQLVGFGTAEKVELVKALDRAGAPEIEITGFAHPRVIPILADAEAVAEGVLSAQTSAMIRALVPNLRGAERAIVAGIPKLSCLIVASETYQRLNSNMTVDENVAEIERIVARCASESVTLMVAIGTAFICPYEGRLPESRILSLVERFVDIGITEITLADSIGLAWPSLVRERVGAILRRWPRLELGLHLHNLAGLALGNAFTAYEAGVRRFDGSVGGIGGGIAMPVDAAHMANVATEDLVYLFESSGVPTGIDATAISDLALSTRRALREGSGHVSGFGTLERFREASHAKLAAKMAAPPGDSSKRPH